MSLPTYISRLRYIDALIRTKSACTAEILCKKLKLSRSTTLEYLSQMKKLGFPIIYSKADKCYSYSIKGKMTDNLFEQEKQS